MLSENIKNLRKEKGMSQDELASLLNTTKQAIYKYESNIVTNIPMDKIETLGKVFNVSPSYIMGWNGGIGDRIKTLRMDWELTTRQLALYINQSEEVVKSWEYGRSTPNIDDINNLAKVFDVTKEQLIADDQELLSALRSSKSSIEKDILERLGIRPVTRKRFQMLGDIACGQPIFANEDHETYIDASADIDADFCLTARGDSMIGAGIKDGDVVFVKQKPIVENGEIAAVVINDEATLKTWYYYPDKQKLVLTPANQNYEPLVYIGAELDEITCLGKAVCYMSKL